MSGAQIAHAPAAGTPRDPETGAPEAATVGRRAARAPIVEPLKRPEVRDVLAWLRLLVEPQDSAAVARALARPPIELRQVELARVIQAARRRRSDLIGGLGAVGESPQVPPEARERVRRFLQLHAELREEIGALEPEAFLGRLVDRLLPGGRALLAPEEATGRQVSLERLRLLAHEFLQAVPAAGTVELSAHLSALAIESEQHMDESQAQAPAAGLAELAQLLREELLADVARIGGRLGELRLDTDLDISHGVVRYLELLKLSALLQRGESESLEEALADINGRLLAAATPLQREILQTSTLDSVLLGGALEGARGERGVARLRLAREEHSLGPFLPRRGGGLALSASDIQTYRACPLRYKYARVLRIPVEQTVHQRFGIVVHQVLERYHAAGGTTLAQLLELLDAAWRRSALTESEADLELLEKARRALTRYHARLQSEPAEAVWFERPFSFSLGPHQLRGRVDRVDRLPVQEGAADQPAYELIDYKTSRAKDAQTLADDIQLALYALAAREDWGLGPTRQAYYYVLDDVKVPLERGPADEQLVAEVVREVGEGILAEQFEPAPSRARCAACDYRIVCPVAEL